MDKLIGKNKRDKRESFVVCMYSHTRVQFLMIWAYMKKRNLIDSIKRIITYGIWN